MDKRVIADLQERWNHTNNPNHKTQKQPKALKSHQFMPKHPLPTGTAKTREVYARADKVYISSAGNQEAVAAASR